MRRFPHKNLPPNPRILVIKLRSIGDVIYNTAVYGPLKKRYPQCHLTVLVEPPSYDIVSEHPDIDEVLVFRKTSFWEQLRFYARLFAKRYDVVIDMHEGTRGAVMCFLSQARYRVGNRRARRSFLYNTKLDFSDLDPQLPIDYQVGLIKKMDVPFERMAPAVHLSATARARSVELLKAEGILPGEAFCILHPGARIYDLWEAEKFAELARILHHDHKLKILLTCGPGQKKLADEIRELLASIPCAFIETGLQELGGITEQARFVVCHNGGYMHFAAALGTPVVGLFGWANPHIWQALGDHTGYVYKNLECSPCSSKTIKPHCLAGRPECKEQITVPDVLLEIEKVYPQLKS